MRGLIVLLLVNLAGCYSSSTVAEALRGTPEGPPDMPPGCRPVTTWGECSVVDQCGCEGDRWCVWRVVHEIDGSCRVHEYCTDVVHGGIGAGERCDSMAWEHPCEPGSTCLDEDFVRVTHSGTCWEFCRTDADCSLRGARCGYPALITMHDCMEPLAMPLPLCSIP
jgi:hypothetical protein